jgi:hypothetical protein
MAAEMAGEALVGLRESVWEANAGFEESMDDMFVSWEESGEYYTKEIVVYSTLWGDTYESAQVKKYTPYEMEPYEIVTDLSERRLMELNSVAIHALIGDAQEEVQAQSEKVFGGAGDNTEKAIASRTKLIDIYRQEKEVTGTEEREYTDKHGNKRTEQVDVIEMVDKLHGTEERITGAGEFGAHIGYAPVRVYSPNIDGEQAELFLDE